MDGEKHFGKSAICPQCRGTRFFAVNFNRTPEIKGDRVEVMVNCEKCNRVLHWIMTCQEWDILKAEYEAAELSEKENV